MAHDHHTVLRGWGDARLEPANGRAGLELFERVTAMIGKERDVRAVCDLGCGNGFLAHRLGQQGYRVTGVDGSDALLTIARTHHAAEHVVFHKVVFGDDRLDVATAHGLFDVAVSVDVVEHLYRPGALVEAAYQVVKPGGVFIVCTPYHGYLKNLAISALGRWDDHHHVHFDGGHIKFFSVATLRQALATQFDVEAFEFVGRFPGFWKNMICIARKPSR
jgi:SAM-dependent methyltransferase